TRASRKGAGSARGERRRGDRGSAKRNRVGGNPVHGASERRGPHRDGNARPPRSAASTSRKRGREGGADVDRPGPDDSRHRARSRELRGGSAEKEDVMWLEKKIVVATDFSEPATAAADMALEL